MRAAHLAASLVLASAVAASAAPPFRAPDGGDGGAEQADDALDPAARAAIEAQLAIARERVPRPRGSAAPPVFGWPLRPREGFAPLGYHGVSNFVDLDPDGPNLLLDWSCGARTYDLASGYDHAGTDFFLWPFAWTRMANEDVEIVAAAPGTILWKDDGHFDGSCAFNPDPWNAVYLLHADGTVSWYGHMKAGTTTAKNAGEAVAEGEVLGAVGSSGSSTAPHLHFEVHDPTDAVEDPFSGPCQPRASLWAVQPPYYDSHLNQVSTHDAEPEVLTCNQVEAAHERTRFDPGETVYLAAYYRDQLAGQTSTYTVRRPNGSVFVTWQHASPEPHYAWSYWFWTSTLPSFAPLGVWHFEVDYLGQHESAAFTVPEPGATLAALAGLAALVTLRRQGR